MTTQKAYHDRSAASKTAVALSMGILMTLSSAQLGQVHAQALCATPSSPSAIVPSSPVPSFLHSASSCSQKDSTHVKLDGKSTANTLGQIDSSSLARRRAHTASGELNGNTNDLRRSINVDNPGPQAHSSGPIAARTLAGAVVYATQGANPATRHDANDTQPAITRHRRRNRHSQSRRFHQNDARHMRSRQISKRSYSLVDSYEGSTFFDGWDFFDYSDPTHGMITYVSAADAFSNGLAYVQGDGVAVMTVDTKSTLNSGDHRKSVRITSKKSYNKGLFIFDILRAPHGCAVWPAAWLVGPNWPNGGEIDVIEGVHDNTVNQVTLHTSSGCMLDTTKSLVGGSILAAGVDPSNVFTGTPLQADCDANINSNAGCGVLDFDPRSYGSGLNNAGGAVYATLWDDSGVRIWFFSRDTVPADIIGKTPDPSTWGSPIAFWASSSCPSSFFRDLSMVFDIVLGGDWAGATFSEAGCPGTVADYVTSPTNFANANWAVNSVRVYQ